MNHGRAGSGGRFASLPSLPHLAGIDEVRWKELPSGIVVLRAPLVNGLPIPELSAYPPLNDAKREELFARYHFLAEHKVLVAYPGNRAWAPLLAREIRTLDGRVTAVREAHRLVNAARSGLAGLSDVTAAGVGRGDPATGRDDPDVGRGEPDGAGESLLHRPSLFVSNRLVKDTYNSFTVTLPSGAEVPSFLHASRETSLASVLLAEIAGRPYWPVDEPVRLHIGVDVSYSMKARGKLPYVEECLRQMQSFFGTVLERTEIVLYLFSDRARRVEGRLTSGALQMGNLRHGETMFEPLYRRVLANRSAARRNKLFVITDGEPSDVIAARSAAELLALHEVDYTQILLHFDDELRRVFEGPDSTSATDGIVETGPDESDVPFRALSDEELDRDVTRRLDTFTSIAEAAGGNQIVLTVYPVLGLLSLELYDRYLGLLTLLDR